MSAKNKVLVYECISAGGLATTAGDIVAPDPGLLAQGVAMRDALLADLQQLDDVAMSCVTTRHAPLPASFARVRAIVADADRPTVPAADLLAREARRHDRVWVIAPEGDGLLADLALAVAPERWIGCTLPAIRVAASKTATRERLAAHGIRVPAAWGPGRSEPESSGRWVVKPDDGAGSERIRVHPDFARARNDLLARRAQRLASTAEAWIDGVPLSLSLRCAERRAELLSINRQRIAVDADGALAYRGVDVGVAPLASPAGQALAALAQRIAAAIPGLAGYVGVDLVWQPAAASESDDLAGDGEATVIEVNPRLTCAYVGLSAALGRNVAAEILRAHQPEPIALVEH